MSAPATSGPVSRGLPAILSDIRFEQTLFSLPFLLLAALVAAGGWPDVRTLGLILVALVGARSSAMAFNRFADSEFDARNPRTAGRAVPSGRVSRRAMGLFAVVAAAIFLLAAASLNTLCLALSPVALVFLVGYSWTKRVTPLCHLVLGTTLGIAPLGAWAAVRGTFYDLGGAFDPGVWFLALGVALWVAGFDVIYACPDAGKDDDEGLHSIPRAVGVECAFVLSAAMHAGAVVAFGVAGSALGLGPLFFVGLGLGVGVLVMEHVLVRPGRYERMATAFFRLNAVFSALLLLTGALDVLAA